MEALSWEFSGEKRRGAQNSECTATVVSKRYFAKNVVFYIINNAGNLKIWILDESSNRNECLGATWGETSHGNGYT